MAIQIGDTIYLNLQEAVAVNTNDINILKTIYGYKGPFPSLGAITDPVDGALYLVGTILPYEIYQYNEELENYTDLGPFAAVGQKGDPGQNGATGPRGPKGDPGDSVPKIELYFPHNTGVVLITEEQYNTLVDNTETWLSVTAEDFQDGWYYYEDTQGVNTYYERNHIVWGPGSYSGNQPIRYLWRNKIRIEKSHYDPTTDTYDENVWYYLAWTEGDTLMIVSLEEFRQDYQDQLPHGTYHLEVTYNGRDSQNPWDPDISAQWVLKQ